MLIRHTTYVPNCALCDIYNLVITAKKITSMASNPVGLALFGAGRAGNIHFLNIVSSHRAELHYVIESDIEKATELVNRYRLNAKVLDIKDAGQAFKDPSGKADKSCGAPCGSDITIMEVSSQYNLFRVEGLIVCSPTFTHEGIIMEGLDSGKTIFCEKPVSQSIEGVANCFKKAKDVGKEIVCSFNRRFDPSIKSLRTRVKNGEIGKVHNIKASARDHPLPPMDFLKTSGGIFHDTGIHDIDMISWILGEYPSVVFSMGHAHNKDIKDMNDLDTVNIVMKFPSDAMAIIDYSRLSSFGYDQRCEVFGTDGMLMSGNQRETEVVHHHRNGVGSGNIKYSFPQRYKESYIGALDHFLDVVRGLAVNEITVDQTLNATKAATACAESYRTGQAVKCDYS